MEDDREKKLREESEQAYQRWLRESGRAEQEAVKTGKKRKELTMRANLKSLPKYLGIGAVFVASALVLNFVLSFLFKLPGLGAVPGWALPTASAILALVVAYTAGLKLTTKKRSFATAFTYLLIFVAASYFLAPQISPVPAPQPIPLPPPSKPPEGYVEFYYQASFTFLGGDTSTIQNVELWLPWPYIDTKETRPFAKPVGLDNWLRVEKGSLGGVGPIATAQLVYNYLLNALRPKEGEITISENNSDNLGFSLNIENGIWTTDRIIDYKAIEDLKITYEGQISTPPVISAYFPRAQDRTMSIFQKITVEVPMIFLGDTVSVEYRFFVSEENATKVRVDDWMFSYWYASETILQGKTYENAPSVTVVFSGPPIKCKFIVTLHKNIGGSNWERVALYQREWNSWRPGVGLITNN